MEATQEKSTKPMKCGECKCILDGVFTGIHIMAKGAGRKTVCGLCSSKLELEGWREITRAK